MNIVCWKEDWRKLNFTNKSDFRWKDSIFWSHTQLSCHGPGKHIIRPGLAYCRMRACVEHRGKSWWLTFSTMAWICRVDLVLSRASTAMGSHRVGHDWRVLAAAAATASSSFIFRRWCSWSAPTLIWCSRQFNLSQSKLWPLYSASGSNL